MPAFAIISEAEAPGAAGAAWRRRAIAYEITVGPALLTINTGECVFVTETNGQVRQPSDCGLFFRDTRLISGWAVEVNGRSWQLLSSAATSHFAAQVVLANPALPTD